MKLLLAFTVLLISNFAMAREYKCTRQVSANNTEYTHITTWPNLEVERSFSACSDEGCSIGGLETIANESQVCFTEIDVKNDCEVSENGGVRVACNNGVSLVFSRASDKGQIACFEGQSQKKVWDLGNCSAVAIPFQESSTE